MRITIDTDLQCVIVPNSYYEQIDKLNEVIEAAGVLQFLSRHLSVEQLSRCHIILTFRMICLINSQHRVNISISDLRSYP